MTPMGFEPTTFRSGVECSTVEPQSHEQANLLDEPLLIRGFMNESVDQPGLEVRANFTSMRNFFEGEFVGELTKQTIHLRLGCIQGEGRSPDLFAFSIPPGRIRGDLQTGERRLCVASAIVPQAKGLVYCLP